MEEEEEMMIKLYVMNIQLGDAGSYTCVRMQGGAIIEEKSVSLAIFSQLDNFSVLFDQNHLLSMLTLYMIV